MNLDEPITQAGFGELVGVSRQAIGELVRREVLLRGVSAREWLVAYCDNLRTRIVDTEGDDLARERARLAREQADRLEMMNAQTRGELAPRAQLEMALASAARQAVAVLEGIPAQIKRRGGPGITTRMLVVIKEEIDKARTVASKIQLSDDPQYMAETKALNARLTRKKE